MSQLISRGIPPVESKRQRRRHPIHSSETKSPLPHRCAQTQRHFADFCPRSLGLTLLIPLRLEMIGLGTTGSGVGKSLHARGYLDFYNATVGKEIARQVVFLKERGEYYLSSNCTESFSSKAASLSGVKRLFRQTAVVGGFISLTSGKSVAAKGFCTMPSQKRARKTTKVFGLLE